MVAALGGPAAGSPEATRRSRRPAARAGIEGAVRVAAAKATRPRIRPVRQAAIPVPADTVAAVGIRGAASEMPGAASAARARTVGAAIGRARATIPGRAAALALHAAIAAAVGRAGADGSGWIAASALVALKIGATLRRPGTGRPGRAAAGCGAAVGLTGAPAAVTAAAVPVDGAGSPGRDAGSRAARGAVPHSRSTRRVARRSLPGCVRGRDEEPEEGSGGGALVDRACTRRRLGDDLRPQARIDSGREKAVQRAILAAVDAVGRGPVRRRPFETIPFGAFAPLDVRHLARCLRVNGNRGENDKERRDREPASLKSATAVANDRPPPSPPYPTLPYLPSRERALTGRHPRHSARGSNTRRPTRTARPHPSRNGDRSTRCLRSTRGIRRCKMTRQAGSNAGSGRPCWSNSPRSRRTRRGVRSNVPPRTRPEDRSTRTRSCSSPRRGHSIGLGRIDSRSTPSGRSSRLHAHGNIGRPRTKGRCNTRMALRSSPRAHRSTGPPRTKDRCNSPRGWRSSPPDRSTGRPRRRDWRSSLTCWSSWPPKERSSACRRSRTRTARCSNCPRNNRR